MKSIFWDTNLFIYLLEDSPHFGQAVADLRRRMLHRHDRLFTSAMTVGEVLVKPLSTNNAELADRYRTLFTGPHVTISPFDFGAAEAYANIRQDRSIYPADAIQLACLVVFEVPGLSISKRIGLRLMLRVVIAKRRYGLVGRGGSGQLLHRQQIDIVRSI